MTVKVITDSTASIPADIIAQEDMGLASLTINTHDGELVDSEIDLDPFYAKYLTDLDRLPTSSQPSVDTMRALFEQAAQAGRDAVGVFISEKMSGTIQSARVAAEIVAKEFPAWSYSIVDSMANSFQEGLVALAAATAAKAGKPLEECVTAAKETVVRTKFLFVPETLENLKRGGRIGRASAIVGGALQIRPVLGIKDGVAHDFKKVRTEKKARETMLKMFCADIERCGLVEAVVHYIGAYADGERFAKEHVEPLIGREVKVYPVSPVIGVHVGSAVGIVYQTENPI